MAQRPDLDALRDPDLGLVVNAWPKLADAMKVGIVAMVKVSVP